MSTQLSKTYEPTAVELEALRVWNDEKLFHAEPADPGDPYSIVIPPPNVTAALHLGHALNNTIQDILIRWRRMAGDNAVWLPGTDHAGIATQTVVEKRVLKEEGKKRTEFKREDFVAKIQAWKDEYEQTITGQLKRMGCSCDWDRQAFTMDEPRARAVREAFFQFFKDGLIYRGKRLVNWDPATQTALADDEVEMEEVDGHFYYLRYPVIDATSEGGVGVSPAQQSIDQRGRDAHATKTEYITVATTRPETMLGDTAVALNPKDPRAAALRGKSVLLPMVGRIIPIIEDEYVVLADPNSDDAKARFATGFLKVTPAHDPNDYDLGRKHNLPTINVMAPDGSISDKHGWTDVGDAGFTLGLDRYEARKAIVEWFRQNKLLEDVKPYRHTVGHSYRSHVPIEPYLSDQWYLKVTDDRLAGAALCAMAGEQRDASSVAATPASPERSTARRGDAGVAATNWEGGLRFYPARYAKTFQTWHENIRDWCISRQLWWGHRIPVWHKRVRLNQQNAADEIMFRGLDHLLNPNDPIYSDSEKWGAIAIVRTDTGERVLDYKTIATSASEYDIYICPKRDEDMKAFSEYSRDPDVLDTWFSSGLWPMSTLGWPEKTAELETWNPTNVLFTDRSIITLWVSRMVMMNLYFLNRLPFTDVNVHATIQDGEGRKMSKSLGNGVDPLDIISSHGADAMRFTIAHMTTQTQDVRMPVEKDPRSGKNTSPKFDLGRNFCNKLWNAARFALQNLENTTKPGPSGPGTSGASPHTVGQKGVASLNDRGATDKKGSDPFLTVTSLSLFDRWILSRLNSTITEVENALKSYRFDAYAKACYDFFWRDLCDWYVEVIKPAMRDPNRAGPASAVLAACLDASLRLMHPMIPFITETLFWKLNEVRAERSIPDIIDLKPSMRLIDAPWPRGCHLSGKSSKDAEAIVLKLQEIIEKIRNVRNEHKADPKRVVSVSIKPSADDAAQIESNRAIIELLAICSITAIDVNLLAPANAAKAIAAGCEIYVEGLADEGAEKQRIENRRKELVKLIATLQGRLSNEGYIAKAPPALVKQTQDQLDAAKKELESLG